MNDETRRLRERREMWLARTASGGPRLRSRAEITYDLVAFGVMLGTALMYLSYLLAEVRQEHVHLSVGHTIALGFLAGGLLVTSRNARRSWKDML